jgi:hypothetical protein
MPPEQPAGSHEAKHGPGNEHRAHAALADNGLFSADAHRDVRSSNPGLYHNAIRIKNEAAGAASLIKALGT